MNIIPSIDLKDGKCVRLYQGDFAQTTEYSDDPVAVAKAYSGLDVTDLHIVDLDGARTGRQDNREVVRAMVRESALAIQLGGGIRDRETLQSWFDAGISRCVIGSLAITEPDAVKSWLVRFGADRIVLALDVLFDEGGTPVITTHGWTRPSRTSVFECIEDYATIGLRHVLCTDVGRDGAMAGPNTELYVTILERIPGLQLQASGGVRNIEDLRALRNAGIPAAITGRALLEGEITAAEIESFLQSE